LSDMALLTLACWCLFVRDWLRLSLREAADEELRRSGCEYDSWQVDIHVSVAYVGPPMMLDLLRSSPQ